MAKVSFLVVGAQKAGTTTLHSYLSEIPGLFLPARKELHYFDTDSHNWDAIDHKVYEQNFASAAPQQICGEVTPAYMFEPRFLERIHRYNAQMRLISILRNPIERAYSGWRMEVSRKNETLPFSAAIREGRDRIHTRWRPFSYVERGFYSAQITAMQAVFPAGQCHVLLTEDMAADPDRTLADICKFLGCAPPDAPLQPQRIQPIEVQNLDPISAADAAFLRDLYAQDILKIAALLGRNLDHWLAGEEKAPA